MKLLYLLLDIGTLLCPVLLSFEKRVNYIRSWKASFLASLIIAVPFLIWDHIFTTNGFWGFNPDYTLGIKLFGLPLEEYLFFIVVPFACTFIYEVVKYYFRNFSLNWFNKIFSFSIPAYGMMLLLFPTYGYYTVSVEVTATLVLLFLLLNKQIKFAGVAFLISMIPFFIMNGILTGGLTEEPVVWYSELEKVPFRLWTIPMEDVLYSFTMIVGNIVVFEKLQQKFSS